MEIAPLAELVVLVCYFFYVGLVLGADVAHALDEVLLTFEQSCEEGFDDGRSGGSQGQEVEGMSTADEVGRDGRQGSNLGQPSCHACLHVHIPPLHP